MNRMNLINLSTVAVLSIIIPQVFIATIAGASTLSKNNEIAKSNEHPWLVSVRKNGQHVCAGSIISEMLILTATWCTEVENLSTVTIRAGSSSIFSGSSVHNVIAATRYRNDSEALIPILHNLAILKVSPLLKISEGVKGIRLANIKQIFALNASVYTTAWDSMTTLHKISLQIRDQCTEQVFDNYQVCAFSLDREKRFSDIGSPLIVNDYLVGVLAMDYKSDSSRIEKVYTKVSAYREWLDRSIIALTGSQPMWNTPTRGFNVNLSTKSTF